MSRNQEEADTKMILHSGHAISTTEGSIILRSSSGDVDVMIIAIRLIDSSKHVLVDYGNGKNKKGVWLNSIDFDDNIGAVLIWFHAFTGNDYASSCFKRGKQGCFKAIKRCEEFINAFRLLGEDWVLKSELIVALESFACHLHGIQRYRYQKSSEKNVWQKVCERRKSHWSIIVVTLPVHIISAHIALQLCCKDLEVFLNQCSRVPRHHGEWLDGKRWNVLGWWCSSIQYHGYFGWQDFDEGSMELELDPQDDSDDENTDD